MTTLRTIGIVDDDEALRDSLGVLLRVKGYDVAEFSSGESLFAAHPPAHLDCLVLDLRLKGMAGLDVLDRCRLSEMNMPVIVVTAFGDVASAKRALRSGAFDFLEKPIREEEMLKVVANALLHFDQNASLRTEKTEFEEHISRLSVRERQVLDAVLAGHHNREIASAFRLSVRTVEVYKARIMEKMRVTRLPELYKLCARMDLPIGERNIERLHSDDFAAPRLEVHNKIER